MNNGESTRPNEPQSQPIDPYAILKVDRNASEESIQRSYKLLSRNFHPDKHAPGPTRDAAQEVFVAFKNSHDILTDPVLRQAYDDHGHVGITYVKRSLHSTERDPNALYPTLVKLHQAGQSEQARLVLREAIQQIDVEQNDRAVHLTATLDFPCTLESTPFFGNRGNETSPELKEAHMSFSVSSTPPTPDHKWTVTAGGSSDVECGKGGASGQVSVGYTPVQGTQISADCDISDKFKASIGTTRTLLNRTLVTTTLRTIPNSRDLSLSIVSHRALFQNNYRGTCAFGFGTNLKLHYGLLSLTTLFSDYPQCTLKLNAGVSSFPVKLSAKHALASGRTGYVSYAWGPMGMELKVIVARALTSYASWSMGIRHATQSGLTWLLQLERNDIVFRIPITICSLASPMYFQNMFVVACLSFLIDDAIGDTVKDVTADLIDTKKKDTLERESSLLNHVKSRSDSEQQVKLMLKMAQSCKEREEACNGLVIRQATYWIDGGESMDATIQLQFWVNDSKLNLPPTPKSHLLGFYSLATAEDITEMKQPWWHFWKSSNKPKDSAIPKLTIRYAFDGNVYEITVQDSAEVVLPNGKALCIGRSDIVL